MKYGTTPEIISSHCGSAVKLKIVAFDRNKKAFEVGCTMIIM